MKIKTILFMVLSLMSFTVFAQNNGGVKGKVVSRTTRAAIDGVKVTLTPGDVTTKTDASGNFVIENLAKGEYTLSFEAAEFEPLTLAVRVDKLIRDINNVILIPENVALRWTMLSLPNLTQKRWRMHNHFPRLCPHQKTYSITSLPTNSVKCVSMYVVMILNTPTFI